MIEDRTKLPAKIFKRIHPDIMEHAAEIIYDETPRKRRISILIPVYSSADIEYWTPGLTPKIRGVRTTMIFESKAVFDAQERRRLRESTDAGVPYVTKEFPNTPLNLIDWHINQVAESSRRRREASQAQ